MLEISANYHRCCQLYLVYTVPDSVLSNFTVVQIELRSMLYVSDLGFIIIEIKKRSEWSLVLLGLCSEQCFGGLGICTSP